MESGTKEAKDVLAAWSKARKFFESEGTIPVSSWPVLDKMKGHGYTAFHSKHLETCQGNNIFLIGDALGLAQPMTGEGILPAVLSAKLCATSIAEGVPESYAKRLRTHPIISDYRILHSIQTMGKKTVKKTEEERYRKSKFLDWLIVTIFAMQFSGKQIPGGAILAKMRK